MGWGDELMATGDAAASDTPVSILDKRGKPRWHPLFENNPKILHPDDGISDVRITHGPSCRPYVDLQAVNDLTRKILAGGSKQECSRLVYTDYRAKPGEVFFTDDELEFGRAFEGRDFVVVEPNVRQISKQWGKWEVLVDHIPNAVQLGIGNGTKLDVPYIYTPTFRKAMAVMAHCTTFVVPEGGMHHAMAALGKRGVVLGNGRSPRGLFYDIHVNWGLQDNPCGTLHFDCPDCRDRWNRLEPEEVLTLGKFNESTDDNLGGPEARLRHAQPGDIVAGEHFRDERARHAGVAENA